MSTHAWYYWPLVAVACAAILTTAGLLIRLNAATIRDWLHHARRLFARHSTMHARPHTLLRRDNWDDTIEDDIIPGEPLLPLPAISHPDNLRVEYWANVARHTASQAALLWEERPVTGRIVSDTAYDRAMSADLRKMLDEISAAQARNNRGFAEVAYQARHALALPAGATA